MKKTALARRFRKAHTEPEQLLWQRLRRHEDGPSFRRQHPMGAYILDFYCPKAKLVVEVDGSQHSDDERIVQDARRDTWLGAQGLEVYRIPASEVYRDADAVADGIKLKAEGLIRERKQETPPPPR